MSLASSKFPNLTKEDVIEDYRRVQTKLSKKNINRTEYLSHGLYPRYYLDSLFGGWNGLKTYVGDTILMNKGLTKEMIAEKAIELYHYNGKLTSTIMRDQGYSQIAVDKNFGSFSNMMKELGLTQEAIGATRNLSDEDFLSHLRKIQIEYGYVNATLLSKHSSIPLASFINRFKTFGEACLRANVRHIGQHSLMYPDGSSNVFLQKVSELLNEPDYHTELTFDWLRNPSTATPLPVDAYFPSKKLIVEYHGPYHYDENNWLNQGKQSIQDIQNKDRLKVRLAKDNGFNIIEYPYDSNEPIESIFKEFIF